MVFRDKTSIGIPTNFSDPRWDALRQAVLLDNTEHNADKKCYRDTTIEALKNLYKNKCAICERDRGFELQVDHFRPRKHRNNQTNAQYNQPGYYWLTYEWTNLIPLCSHCNGKKSNKFPLTGFVENNRISSHENILNLADFQPYCINWLQNREQPLMVNPELERHPERHFIFHKKGKIVGRTLEGIETINICRLNRPDLKRERLQIREVYTQAIKEAYGEFQKNRDSGELRGALKTIFRSLKSNCDIDKPHSLYHIFIFKYFDYFIGTKLPKNLRATTLRYFNAFNNP